jgi:hypothetical protein
VYAYSNENFTYDITFWEVRFHHSGLQFFTYSLLLGCLLQPKRDEWSVVAEWLGRRTLNQRVVGSNPGEGTARYL